MIFENSDKLLLIAGPCSLECEALSMQVAEVVADIAKRYENELTVVFKGSFDKANRTSLKSPRGPGIDEGLQILANVKSKFGLPVLTDIHETSQCAKVAEVCDVLQIPAFLSRQTDLLVAAAQTGKVVNVKKGQFMSPYDMKYAVSKLRDAGCVETWQTDRGTTFGYGNLVVDMRSFPIMAENNTPVIIDATHSTQLPSANAGVSGGDRRFVKPLAKAAIAAGANGLFIETHPEPEKALSDAATQLPLNELEDLLKVCIAIKKAIA
ncbi:MAG: 3-deoxy-8-phosphooctulonate synthase [Verrucomicrobiaceae bacterium]|nr:3-deoxy-8-phosphooctulonate synthase [Verrucomicrobiaceae bacterium]